MSVRYSQRPSRNMAEPIVKSIYIAPSQGQPMVAIHRAEVVGEKGIVGDRYYLGLGHYSGDKIWDANVTLIEQEAHDEARREANRAYAPDCLRRNIITQNVELKSLLGHDFKIGSVVLRGTKEWPPCKYIDAMHPGQELLRHFAKSAGIGATVIQSGSIQVGDVIADLGKSPKE